MSTASAGLQQGAGAGWDIVGWVQVLDNADKAMGSKTAMADGSAAASDAVSRAGCDSEATIGTMQRVSARDSPKLDAMELEQEVPCRSSASSRQGLRSKTWIGRAKWGWRGKVSGRPGRLKTLVLVVVFPGKVWGDSFAGDEDGDGGMGGEKKTD